MIFRRRRAPRPELTNDAFRRWLRAWRPPLEFFLGLSEIEQEQLAMMGDAYSQELLIGVGYAVRDPVVAEAGAQAISGAPAGEETLVRKLVEGFVAGITSGKGRSAPQDRPRAAPPTMAGFGSRNGSGSHQDDHADPGGGLFGKPPDGSGQGAT